MLPSAASKDARAKCVERDGVGWTAASGRSQVDAFELADLEVGREAAGRPYLEFVRSSELSAGLYCLPAGGLDRQSPHTEDEVYVVIRGRARIAVGAEDAAVGPGSVVFVAAGIDHRFHDIEEDLSVIVVFAPPEGARG
jgi:mannose-6-phosphate isomerase-like protein (cupin superfamily)